DAVRAGRAEFSVCDANFVPCFYQPKELALFPRFAQFAVPFCRHLPEFQVLFRYVRYGHRFRVAFMVACSAPFSRVSSGSFTTRILSMRLFAAVARLMAAFARLSTASKSSRLDAFKM